MNRIYRKVWNKALGQLVVASEFASGDSVGAGAGVGTVQRQTRAGLPVALGAVLFGLAAPGALAQSVAIGDSGPCVVASWPLVDRCAVDGSAVASGVNAVAIGTEARATGAQAVAIGAAANASAPNTVSLGASAQATTTSASALGANARATAANATAAGAGANAQ
ncbi:hypothetical protein CMZ81_13105, partial [Lysobacteraceae bacterium NML93-0793]